MSNECTPLCEKNRQCVQNRLINSDLYIMQNMSSKYKITKYTIRLSRICHVWNNTTLTYKQLMQFITSKLGGNTNSLTLVKRCLLLLRGWKSIRQKNRRDRTCLEPVHAVSVYQFPDNFAFLQLNGQLLFFSY